jgi:hypothetical protein
MEDQCHYSCDKGVCCEYASSVAHMTVPSLKRIFKLELPHHLDNNNNDRMNLCCKCASAVCYSLWLYCEMLLENYMDRVSGRLLSKISTSEMAIDGRRPPYTVMSDIKRLVYILHSPYVENDNIEIHCCSFLWLSAVTI